MSVENQVLSTIQKEFHRRVFTEGVVRIKKCMSMLSEEQIWTAPNPQMNSVGNLVLHLAGNVQQWINATLGSAADERVRNEEFSKTIRLSRQELESRLDRLESDTGKTLDALTEEHLVKTYAVQCYEESGLSILIHVIEHFSYHVGQITLLTKLFTERDTGYYAGEDLSRTQ